MPLKSSTSSVLVWPTRAEVADALRTWAADNARQRPELLKLGYFGSLAGGGWGVGSDVDIVAIVRDSRWPFERRAVDWDLTPLPVAADLLVYTEPEWQALTGSGSRFGRMLAERVVWIVGASHTPAGNVPGVS